MVDDVRVRPRSSVGILEEALDLTVDLCEALFLQKVIELLQCCGSMDAPLSIYVQRPAHRHQGIFKESISVLFDYCAKQWYVDSGSDGPELATSARASNCGGSRRGRASSRILSRNPCIGSRLFAEPVAASLATVSSSNHVGRTLCGFLDSVVRICSQRRL